jgi:ubiquinone/menaquinone biosynthesis C-methylase UbiE
MQRTLEPEVMDTADDAREYDAMDQAAVNAVFVDDLLVALKHATPTCIELTRSHGQIEAPIHILDLGVGTAQILIELARQTPHVHITAVDAAKSMLELAGENIAAANLADRITLIHADAKQLPFADATFHVVISNSIVHHIPEPRAVLAQAVRTCAPGGLLFHRDLARPYDESKLEHLVNTYAAEANPYQRRLFEDSLRAALTAEEMGQLVADFGFDPSSVQMTSDRHWTWCAKKPSR